MRNQFLVDRVGPDPRLRVGRKKSTAVYRAGRPRACRWESTNPSKTRRRPFPCVKKKKNTRRHAIPLRLSSSRRLQSGRGSQHLGEEKHGTAAVVRWRGRLPFHPNPISKRRRRRSPIVRACGRSRRPSIDPNLQVRRRLVGFSPSLPLLSSPLEPFPFLAPKLLRFNPEHRPSFIRSSAYPAGSSAAARPYPSGSSSAPRLSDPATRQRGGRGDAGAAPPPPP